MVFGISVLIMLFFGSVVEWVYPPSVTVGVTLINDKRSGCRRG